MRTAASKRIERELYITSITCEIRWPRFGAMGGGSVAIRMWA